MSFDQSNFAPVGANSADSPHIFSYKTADKYSEVSADNYFFEKRYQLSAGDLILSCIDCSPTFIHVLESTDCCVKTAIEASNAESSMLAFHDGEFFLSEDDTAPDFLTGDGVSNVPDITFNGGKFFELWDAATLAVKNISGKSLNVSGSISWHPIKTLGGTSRIVIGSESSFDDGLTWSLNQGSNRPNEINNDGSTFQSKISFFDPWLPDQIVRFRIYNGGRGTIQIASSSDPMLDSILTGHSIIWALRA